MPLWRSQPRATKPACPNCEAPWWGRSV